MVHFPRAGPLDISATWSNLAGLGSHSEFRISSFLHYRSTFSCGLKKEKKKEEEKKKRPFLLIFPWRSAPSTVAQYGFPLSNTYQDFFLTEFGGTRMNIFVA